MATLLLRLAGAMQSWGTRSRFDERDTNLEPSKSGVLGLVCAALGRDRHEQIAELASLRMGVRVDREGVLRRDYQTAKEIISADGNHLHRTAVTVRYYLADAVFLVGLEGDREVLGCIHTALDNPHWTLSLGRKSYVPSLPVYLKDGLRDEDLQTALNQYPYLASLERPANNLRFVIEAVEGALRTDQPLAPFAERQFGVRYVKSHSHAWQDLFADTKTNDVETDIEADDTLTSTVTESEAGDSSDGSDDD